MENKLKEYIDYIGGNVLITGLQYKSVIEKINKEVSRCYLLEDNKLFTNKKKIITLKKFEKLLDKNKIKDIICNYNTNKDIFDIIPGKFYLDGRLYLYGYMTKDEISDIEEKCSYYTSNIEDIKCTDGDLLIIGSKRKYKSEPYYDDYGVSSFINFLGIFK